MKVTQSDGGGFRPIELKIVLETPKEVELFRKLVSNNVTIPLALVASEYITTNEKPQLAAIMSQLNSFVG